MNRCVCTQSFLTCPLPFPSSWEFRPPLIGGGTKGGTGVGGWGQYSRLANSPLTPLRDCHLIVEIDVLNRVEQPSAFVHGTLKGFATTDQPHTTGALVDDRGFDSIGEIIVAAGAAGVDQADLAHIAVGDLITSQIDGVIAAELAIDALVEFAVRRIAAV